MNFIKDLLESSIKTERVEGFKKLVKAGLPIPDAKIIEHEGFLFYKEKGMQEPLQKELEAVFFSLRQKYPKRGFYVGRAFSVPGLANPPGPYSVVKTEKEIVKGVIKLYDFALQNKYDKKGAKIGVITYPWIDPKAPLGGGCISLSVDGGKRIIIDVIYGLDEGVQSFPHDFYILDFASKKILKTVITEKKECLEADENFLVKTVKVPKKLWDIPVLSIKEVSELANDFQKFVKIYGPHRLEFGFHEKGLYFYRECVPFVLKHEKAAQREEEGRVFRLNTKSDLPKIGSQQRIIFVDPIVIKKRQMNLLTFLATQTQDKKIILFPGSATTGHMATIFRETGHLVAFVGNQVFGDGDEVLIKTKNGELAVENL